MLGVPVPELTSGGATVIFGDIFGRLGSGACPDGVVGHEGGRERVCVCVIPVIVLRCTAYSK
jgi:hypothetical protein